MSQNAVKGVKDFCISYTQADRPWAEWIAWHLEEAGYSTVLQPWHVRPASNVVMEMDRATQVAICTLVVLSSEYLHADDTKAEWAAAFNRDPRGQQGILVPVRVHSCDVVGLCGSIAPSIDLVNLDEPRAREALLTGAQRARARPARSPSFLGGVSPRFPGAPPPLWLVPFRRNSFFTGREEVLRCLHDPFTTGTPTAVTQMISGLGGIGKTQTAVEYAYRYQSEYRAVLWVRADSQQSIISSFIEIAHVLKLPEHDAKEQEQIVQAVKWWLRTGCMKDSAGKFCSDKWTRTGEEGRVEETGHEEAFHEDVKEDQDVTARATARTHPRSDEPDRSRKFSQGNPGRASARCAGPDL